MNRNKIFKSLCKKDVLSSEEIRYFRNSLLNLSQAKIGKILGVSHQAVARWEKSTTPLPITADRLLKMYMYSYLALADARPIFQIINDMCGASIHEPQ